MLPHDEIQVCNGSDVAFFSVCHIKRHPMSICPIIGDGNFNRLVNMVTASFLLCNVFFL